MTTHSARPLTAREPGRVYGSWMDDPRRLLERRLNEMKAGERFEFSGYVIARPGYAKALYVRQAGKVAVAHHASGPAAKQSVIEFVIGKPDKGTEEMSEYTISKRAMELLHAANKPLGVSTSGKGTMVAIKALQRQGLVEIWKDGKCRTTEKGREFLIDQMRGKVDSAPAAYPITSNSRGLNSWAKEEEQAAPADELRIEVVNEPIRKPEPEPAPSSNGVVHETIDPVTAELHTFGGCSCAHRRALEYLMEQVPDLRDAVENFFALEKSVARLQGSAPHAPESARMKGQR